MRQFTLSQPGAISLRSIKIPIFEAMQSPRVSGIQHQESVINSSNLDREVKLDFYVVPGLKPSGAASLLFINDGQNLEEMNFRDSLDELSRQGLNNPLICVGIHAGKDRKHEYGVAGIPDYLGRGERAQAYTNFITDELLPHVHALFKGIEFRNNSFAGFSLGGLMALDIVWTHPSLFKLAGVFSGSLWWRSIDQEDPDYDDDKHRIMHQRIRNGSYHPGLRFFFQCGNKDETMDRNKNGIIDSIDDTRDLISELANKGYEEGRDISYLEMPDGRHDIETWARAMPDFLKLVAEQI